MKSNSPSRSSFLKTNRLAAAILLAGFSFARAAETVTLIAGATQTATGIATDSDSYTLPVGKIAVVESAYMNGSGAGNSLSIVRNGKRVFMISNNQGLSASNSTSSNNAVPPSKIVLAGPLQFDVSVSVPAGSNGTTSSALLTITIFTQAEYTARVVGTQHTAQSGTASNAVAIPADATGPVSILMESSQDMISWNAANPGNYGAATPNRFFRLRAVAN